MSVVKTQSAPPHLLHWQIQLRSRWVFVWLCPNHVRCRCLHYVVFVRLFFKEMIGFVAYKQSRHSLIGIAECITTFSKAPQDIAQTECYIQNVQVLYKHCDLYWSWGIRRASMELSSVSPNTGLLFWVGYILLSLYPFWWEQKQWGYEMYKLSKIQCSQING